MSAPVSSRPIVIIGAGNIVRDAHLPAYKKAGFSLQGIFDVQLERAQQLGRQYGIPVFQTLEDAASAAKVETVFDVAVPPSSMKDILHALPDNHGVLIQKPMGGNIEQARSILEICRSKKLVGAVNFQLRFAPPVALARSMILRGEIGDLIDMEVRVTCYTPWQIWPFLEGVPRMEILYHSIHYVDLIRSFLGDPSGVYALSTRHPIAPRLTSTSSTIIMNYGDMVRANIETNHGHNFGPKHQESYVKWEGTKGAIKICLGLLLDYPKGRPDHFEQVLLQEGKEPDWLSTPVDGSWFPHAFMHRMASLISYLDGSTDNLPASVEDAYRTMAVVEAAYESSGGGGTTVHYD
jgi:predicted dehydrogenase